MARGRGTKPDRREIPKGRYHFETTSTAILRVKPDVARTTLRTGISEHPFGTIKTAMGGGHLLLRGLGNAEAEFSLVCLGYNIRRAANLLGFGRLMELMGSFLALLRAALLSAGSSQSQNQSQTWLLTC